MLFYTIPADGYKSLEFYSYQIIRLELCIIVVAVRMRNKKLFPEFSTREFKV